MPISLKMPALSPTMEEGTLAKWLVKEGDSVSSGDLLAEIETDKATMEFEAIDEGTVAKIIIAGGTDGVKVGEVIAILAEEGENAEEAANSADTGTSNKKNDLEAKPEETANKPDKSSSDISVKEARKEDATKTGNEDTAPVSASAPTPTSTSSNDRIKASPLARRIAEQKGVDLSSLQGSGPGGRIVKADIKDAKTAPQSADTKAATTKAEIAPAPAVQSGAFETDIPHTSEKLSNMRKTIARRLTEAKQTIPHIYLTVDIRLDALLKLRSELNAALESREIKLSVNDMLIKALAMALIQVPKCNVSFAGDTLIRYQRADISVAVSIPGGLITPIVTDAGSKSMSAIATKVKELAGRAKEGKLKPEEYQGGTASISNMGMYGIKQFDAVINLPQGMILAIGAGEKRPAVIDDSLQIATIMSATGSFDHRAIDGADGAELMKVLKVLVENPLGLVA